jgi:predicted N-acetyltransferase YhbS
MKLEYRPLQQGDEAALSALHREVFGVDFPIQYWDWKYYQNPAGEHDAYVAVADGAIGGEIATIPVKVKLGAELATACQTCDVAIAPQYRKGTPFFRLHKAAAEEVTRRGWVFVYGIAIETTYKISTKMLGFVGAGHIRKLVKILNPAPFLAERMKAERAGKAIGSVGSFGLKLVDSLRTRDYPDIEVAQIERFDSAFDDFWLERSSDFEIMGVRDSCYLNWRFFQNPMQTYDVFCARRNGKLSGFIVLCMRAESKIRRGYIVDFLVPPQDGEVACSLIQRAVSHFHAQKADNITVWLPERAPIFDFFKRNGFLERETPHDLIVRSHGKWANDYLADATHWFLTMGDSDNY